MNAILCVLNQRINKIVATSLGIQILGMLVISCLAYFQPSGYVTYVKSVAAAEFIVSFVLSVSYSKARRKMESENTAPAKSKIRSYNEYYLLFCSPYILWGGCLGAVLWQ